MTENYSAELLRQVGGPFRSIDLSVHSDGFVKLDAQDMGKAVKEMEVDDDYEFCVNVPASELRKLAFFLLQDKYSGRSGAVSMSFAPFVKRGHRTQVATLDLALEKLGESPLRI